MSDTSNVGSAKNVGLIPLKRLRPFEIATLLIPLQGGELVRVMDATDAQFQGFIKDAGVPVDDQGIVEWSFDDRCGIINHALKYGVALPFVEQNQFANNSQPNKNNSPSELLPRPESAPQAVIATPQERVDLAHVVAIVQAQPNITDNELADKLGFRRPASARFWRLKAFEVLGWLARDAHPLEPMPAPSSHVRQYPDLEGE
jgi:hypothetical protein